VTITGWPILDSEAAGGRTRDQAVPFQDSITGWIAFEFLAKAEPTAQARAGAVTATESNSVSDDRTVTVWTARHPVVLAADAADAAVAAVAAGADRARASGKDARAMARRTFARIESLVSADDITGLKRI